MCTMGGSYEEVDKKMYAESRLLSSADKVTIIEVESLIGYIRMLPPDILL
jgi:hypothetical protein